MREERPSQTASFVALARALAHDGLTSIPGFADPVARGLLSRRWSFAYRLLSRALRKGPRRERAIARLDVIPLRVVAIDAEVVAAVERGCRQLVVLGAGLDSRAYRMSALRDVAVFEVDHPATQAWKRGKAPPPLARSLAFVPVDFEKDSLAERLGAAGFRPDVPTVWIWEGVVMYLTDDALARTLADVGRLSSPLSTLLVHYHEPYELTGAREERGQRLLLAFWREPQIGRRPPAVMHEAAKKVGFTVASDTRPTDWAERARARVPTGLTAAVTHLLVAIRHAETR